MSEHEDRLRRAAGGAVSQMAQATMRRTASPRTLTMNCSARRAFIHIRLTWLATGNSRPLVVGLQPKKKIIYKAQDIPVTISIYLRIGLMELY